MNEGHEEALHIIETHREQHRLIAEALLEYETLDEKQILSLYKTGKMPEKAVEEADSEQRAQTFEEAKQELERKENARATADQESAADQPTTSADQPSTTDADDDQPADSDQPKE